MLLLFIAGIAPPLIQGAEARSRNDALLAIPTFHCLGLHSMLHRLSTAAFAVYLATVLATAAAEPESGHPQGGTTYYVDSVAGRNSNVGSSPSAAWQDFSNLNGQTLNAGDRLLIKRGSVINQELRLRARGKVARWVEIGADGDWARPTIRRNCDIAASHGE